MKNPTPTRIKILPALLRKDLLNRNQELKEDMDREYPQYHSRDMHQQSVKNYFMIQVAGALFLKDH